MNALQAFFKKLTGVYSWFQAALFWKKAALCLLLAAVTIGLYVSTGKSSAKPQYQTASVERGTIVSSVSASGTVLTSHVSNIVTDAQGVVSHVFVKDGDSVIEGNSLATIDLDQVGQQAAASAYASYLSAKNAVDSAQISYYTLQSDMLIKWQEFKALAENDTYENADGTPRGDARTLPEFVTVQNDWLAAEAKYIQQKLVVSQLQSSLSSAWLSYQRSSGTIVAPSTGILANVTIVPGMTFTRSSSSSTSNATSYQRIAVITSPGRPLITVAVTEIDVSKINVGQKATVTVDSLEDKSFTGVVESVDKLGTVTSNVSSYPIIIRLDTEIPELLPNMAVQASIILETRTDVLKVPASSVTQENGLWQVGVLAGGKEEMVPVEVGMSSDTETEIRSGVGEGDIVITGSITAGSTQSSSVFGSGFGGSGAFRSGGFGGGNVRVIR